MTQYIIENNTGEYLGFDDCKKLYKTSNAKSAASFETRGKAYNVLTCSLPKKKRTGWSVVERKVAEEPQPEPNTTQENSPQRYRSETSEEFPVGNKPDWEALRKNFEEAYKDIVTYKKEVREQLITTELELYDCEHACEFFKCNASKGYKLYSMIHERRVKRRYLKNEYKKAMVLLNMPHYDIVNGKLEDAFKKIDEQSYEPRVLKELFDV